MIKIYRSGEIERSAILARDNAQGLGEAEKIAKEIVDDVRRRGDEAVLYYCRKFDGAELSSLRVSEEEIDDAVEQTGDFIDVLKASANNIREFHLKQKRHGFEINKEGVILGQRILPLTRAGIYVPGGRAAYPSTVLMCAIPAAVAGVGEVVMTTPCGKDGKIRPEILAAARIAGVNEIYKVGGAQGVAMLALGTESVKRVDKIVGPGNAYVAAAKKIVSGEVGIDMFAGPSEILVIADKTARADYLAADLLSQAEHDPLATAVLVVTDETLGKLTASEIEKQLSTLPRAEIAQKSIDTNGKIIIVKDLDEAVEISDSLAPEHLEIMTAQPEKVLEKVHNAGSVFLGSYSPESLGDYFAGPNHTLPTSGTAKFSSPLGVDDFIKRQSYIKYSLSALKDCGEYVARFAEREGLSAHAKSILSRMDEE